MKPNKKPEFQFNQAQIEKETDADDLEASVESVIFGPDSVGAEIATNQEQHAEAPLQDRQYRNLNEQE